MRKIREGYAKVSALLHEEVEIRGTALMSRIHKLM